MMTTHEAQRLAAYAETRGDADSAQYLREVAKMQATQQAGRWYTVRVHDRHVGDRVEVQRNRYMTGAEVLRDLTIAAEHGCFDVFTFHDGREFIAGWNEQTA